MHNPSPEDPLLHPPTHRLASLSPLDQLPPPPPATSTLFIIMVLIQLEISKFFSWKYNIDDWLNRFFDRLQQLIRLGLKYCQINIYTETEV